MVATVPNRARGGFEAGKVRRQQADLTMKTGITALRPDLVEDDPILETIKVRYVPANELSPAQVAAWNRLWAKVLPEVQAAMIEQANGG